MMKADKLKGAKGLEITWGITITCGVGEVGQVRGGSVNWLTLTPF